MTQEEATNNEMLPVNAIEVENLTKVYGSKVAVDNLSFTVPEQTITGFIGPNGAGKTTTLRILATLLGKSRGRVHICGKDLNTMRKKIRHDIGFMPDYFGLYDNMTTVEYLDFFAAAYHIPFHEREKLIRDLLELLDLTAKENSLVSELSKGMQQRVSLGRALVNDPKILLLDEPASGLDPRARIELIELLRELRNMGKTIFISSHILAELKDLCDFVVIIEQGKMVYNGTVSQAITAISGEKQRLRISLLEMTPNVVEALKTLEGIEEVEQRREVIILQHDIAKIKACEINSFLTGQGFLVEEIIKERANLEDVFMSLTKGGIA